MRQWTRKWENEQEREWRENERMSEKKEYQNIWCMIMQCDCLSGCDIWWKTSAAYDWSWKTTRMCDTKQAIESKLNEVRAF